MASPPRRQRLETGEVDVALARKEQIHATGQCQVTLVIAQGLASQVQRDQR